jgi:hypothetical protein
LEKNPENRKNTKVEIINVCTMAAYKHYQEKSRKPTIKYATVYIVTQLTED